ncbi:MAG: hypothetical protein CLLPBCKN_008344 [Chroococcidiopsis cubana SAG 39.79]|nr:hypothetical protein [Chroococcidiopsis cubana SAG 39.79]
MSSRGAQLCAPTLSQLREEEHDIGKEPNIPQ